MSLQAFREIRKTPNLKTQPHIRLQDDNMKIMKDTDVCTCPIFNIVAKVVAVPIMGQPSIGAGRCYNI